LKLNSQERSKEVRQKLVQNDEIQKEISNSAPNENYRSEFEYNAEQEAVILAEVDVNYLQNENKEMENEKREKKLEEKSMHEQMIHELKNLKEESQDLLTHKQEIFRNQIIRSDKKSERQTQQKYQNIQVKFGNSEKTLKKYLTESIHQVTNIYRDLSLDYKDSRHNLAGPSNENVDNLENFKNTPQVLEIYLSTMRCVKDKLPRGRFIILCSVLDHIGGNAIEFKKSHSRKWSRVTNPKRHSGEHSLNNLIFDESILLQVPPRASVRPSMVILFELFMLKSKDYSQDQVLGWGVFPLIDSNFELNKGRFKVFFYSLKIDTDVIWTCR